MMCIYLTNTSSNCFAAHHQIPFDFAQGRLSTPLRSVRDDTLAFAENDLQDHFPGAAAPLKGEGLWIVIVHTFVIHA